MKREDLLAPEKYNIVEEIQKYSHDPSKLALRMQSEDGTVTDLTYAELIENVNKIGNAFLGEGLQKGDIILVMMPRHIKAYEIYLAALKTGIVVLPSSEMLKAKDLQYRIQHGNVKAIVSYYPYIEEFDQLPESAGLKKFVVSKSSSGWIDLDERMKTSSNQLSIADTSKEDMAFLSYTSGTTGNPKGVVHTHGWGYAHLRAAAPNWLCIEEGDMVWATAGPGWQKWIWSPFLSVLGSGASGFIYTGRFEPNKYLELLELNHISVLCCTPTEYRLMAKADKISHVKLDNLRSAVSAGEPLNREVIETFKRYFNVAVRDGYGQTENTLLVGITRGMELRPGSMGKPIPGNRVEIINEEGKPCGAGEIGDIAVHIETPALFKNYFKDPERTAMQFRGDYYVTGDRAKRDEDGYFWFEGRRDDIIISSGYTIGPFEVEDALVKHPLVTECAVVGKPDPIRGTIVKAFVVLREKAASDMTNLIEELQNHVKQLTAPYKYPREIEFIDELPKTTSGKIRRVELRQMELDKTNSI